MPIRVLLVEDSLIALTVLRRILESSPDIEVVGTAQSGIEALALIPDAKPDVICTDFHMPKMNGLEFTTQVMVRHPLPILVVSASVEEKEDAHRIFQLLEAGAVDMLPKPNTGLQAENILLKKSLISKVKVLSGVKVFRKKQSTATSDPALNSDGPNHRLISKALADAKRNNPKIIVVGASTGGPLALQKVFAPLPAKFSLPIICVQHIGTGFLQGLIDWLSANCRLSVQIAPAGKVPQPGHIYFPPEQQHLELDERGQFVYSQSPLVDGHRPSVTTTFSSAAHFYRQKAVGILLTGMGRDGASGMKKITDLGGFTIAQDEATSIVFGMPKEAISIGAASQVLPIQAIAPALLKLAVHQSLPQTK
ncbi:MAG: chemotaxis-specific protein-glutamate methyltransferase CheB [Elainellaceae cyanobacterium]